MSLLITGGSSHGPGTRARPRGALEQRSSRAWPPRPAADPRRRAGRAGQQLAYTTVMTTLSRLDEGRAVPPARGPGVRLGLRGGPDGAQASMTARRMLGCSTRPGPGRGAVALRGRPAPRRRALLERLLADAVGDKATSRDPA